MGFNPEASSFKVLRLFWGGPVWGVRVKNMNFMARLCPHSSGLCAAGPDPTPSRPWLPGLPVPLSSSSPAGSAGAKVDFFHVLCAWLGGNVISYAKVTHSPCSVFWQLDQWLWMAKRLVIRADPWDKLSRVPVLSGQQEIHWVLCVAMCSYALLCLFTSQRARWCWSKLFVLIPSFRGETDEESHVQCAAFVCVLFLHWIHHTIVDLFSVQWACPAPTPQKSKDNLFVQKLLCFIHLICALLNGKMRGESPSLCVAMRCYVLLATGSNWSRLDSPGDCTGMGLGKVLSPDWFCSLSEVLECLWLVQLFSTAFSPWFSFSPAVFAALRTAAAHCAALKLFDWRSAPRSEASRRSVVATLRSPTRNGGKCREIYQVHWPVAIGPRIHPVMHPRGN